jgi:hypothetical protein
MQFDIPTSLGILKVICSTLKMKHLIPRLKLAIIISLAFLAPAAEKLNVLHLTAHLVLSNINRFLNATLIQNFILEIKINKCTFEKYFKYSKLALI